ncbi:hypothetical protein B0J18DRAFT_474431 [Chaetomium sp. MPI-SDFR-AT-0129]|nr:hypothetical protein B0J18DRAFT_474431 [Chaetomium sp. MPI-SDFR-AT-0129]
MPQTSSDYPGAAGSPGTTTHSIDRKRLDLGLQILDFVHEYRVLLRNLMLHIYRVIRMPVVPHKVMLPAVDSLCRLIDHEVAGNDANHDDDAKLRTVIHLFQSSYQAIPGTKLTTPSQVGQSIAGENLRWETIGNMIAMASLCLVHIHDRDLALLDPEKRSKNDLIPPFNSSTDGIMTLTSASPVVNELLVCLKYNHLLLAFHRFGDSSHHVYSIFMELASSVYATGMHQDRTVSSGPADHPGFMHQWRRRCFTAIFSLDKTVATILGRPPIIHRHYCVLDAPLDLEDDDLTGPQCEHELQKLDQNGWNTDGRRRSTSYMRLRYLLAMLREEALELLLGSSVGPPDRAHCPSNMKYSSAVTSTATLSPHDTWFLLGFYIDYLYSTFLVFRSKAQQDQSPETLEMLLFAAKDVLSTVLIFNEQRELLREVRSDFSAVFLPYGLPCADVLATELLRRSVPFPYPVGSAGSAGPHLPRSEVIRELTVYVSCLGWVPRRGSHNSKFCKEVQARLTRVLDQIIDAPLPPPQAEETLPDVRDQEGDGGQSHAMLGYPGQAASNLNPFLIDLETGMFLDSQLDLFSQALL